MPRKPLPRVPLWEDMRALVRFWFYTGATGQDDCWLWSGARNHRGYGHFSQFSRHIPAHRASWEIANEQPFPYGFYACHTCDNPGCVNPAHIWPGTQADNLADMFAKGRRQKKSAVPPVGARGLRFCKRGHELTPENTRKATGAGRRCAACSKINQQEWRARRRALLGRPGTVPGHSPASPYLHGGLDA